MVNLIETLPHLTKKRVQKLLASPYQCSKAFRINHSQARYYSNCHGTMAYILNLQSPCINHPEFIPTYQMEELIEKRFSLDNRLELGDLVGFYKRISEKENVLLHTALCVGDEYEIFHQSGAGGIFEINNYNKKLNSFKNLFEDIEIEMRSFRFKN